MENLRRIRLTARSSVKCQYVSFGSFFPERGCVNVVGNDLRRLFEYGYDAVVLNLDQSDEPSGYQTSNSISDQTISFRNSAAQSV